MEGKKTEKDDEEKKFYRFPEDELEDNIDNLEEEMKNMLSYLDDVDGMMGNDDDLKQIKRMIDYSGATMKEHFAGVDKISDNVTILNGEAFGALSDLSNSDRGNKDLAN
jgi:hypothetical protein